MKGFTFLIFLSFMIGSGVFAQTTVVEGDGRFYSRDDDTLSFIKKQLLSSAFRDVFSKELKEMGLDSDKFWRRYEEKFQDYFDPIKESLEKKYGIGVKGEKPKKDDFQKALRQKRLALKARYGRLSRAISQYSIKKMSRSPQVPNSRYLRLRAKVDRKELHRIYLQFTADNPEKHYSTLYMTLNFRLTDTSWVETGVEIESDFTEVLTNHWKEKLQNQVGSKVDRIIITDPALVQELERFSSVNSEVRKNVAKGEVAETEEGAPLTNDFGSSLWMTLNFGLKKIKENKDTQRRVFEMSGDMLIKDLSSQNIIAFADFPDVESSFSYEEPKKISSGLANAIYQMPLGEFKRLEEEIVASKTDLKKVVIDIVKYDHLGELKSLMKILGNKGITKQFNPALQSFTPNNAKILLEYSGKDEEMMAILRSLQDTLIGVDKKIAFPQPEQVFQMALIRPDAVMPLEKTTVPKEEEAPSQKKKPLDESAT